MTEVAVTNEREIQPMQLSLEQLNGLKTQHEEEIQELQKQMENLYNAKNRFLGAKATLKDIETCENENKIMVPLTASLYVPGKIINNEKVMVELGTGYFCEKTIDKSIELIDRKSQLLNKSIESVEKISMDKRRTLEQLIQVMQYKLQMAQNK